MPGSAWDAEGTQDVKGARGWGVELGINSSFARSEKLYNLVRPKDARMFISLRAINKDCRYLADTADGNVPNPNKAEERFGVGRDRDSRAAR